MKKNLLSRFLLLIVAMCTTSLFAQDWVSMMQDPNTNFFETQKAFNKYCDDYRTSYKQVNGKAPEKVPGEKVFKRWEWFMAPRVSQTGERFAPDAAWKAMDEYRKGYDQPMAGNWTQVGPSNFSGTAGAGRLNFCRVHPTTGAIYVGSPSGGLWVSTDNGSTWSTNTDKISQVIGCTDIAFDPTNPQVMYLATGDGDAGDNYTVGILKTTDGGTTWNTTGLSFAMAQFRQISKVLVDATGNTILAATSGGIYRSTDAGATFAQVQTGSFKDMERNPGTPNTIYVCGTSFYRSTDGGATWTVVTTGLPTAANLSRMAMAVTPAAANTIYLVAMKATTNDIYGVYKSTNSGANWSTLSTNSPSIGNQGWYDLCIAANPSNANEVILGGQVELLRNSNGGTGAWTDISGSPHVDYHDLMYTSSSTVYLASDGGLWRSTNNGTSWSELSNSLVIGQPYGFGCSATNANLMIMGRQDNGSDIYNGTSWNAEMGADGMLAFISGFSDSYMWCSSQYGTLYRTSNGGGTWNSATGGITEYSGISGPGPWVCEWNEDPSTANTLYAGFNNVWKSTNAGSSWTKLGTISTNTAYVNAIAAVPTTNSQVIYAAKAGTLYKTVNGGTNWTALTGLPAGTITDIACHATNTQRAWITYSGFNNSNKVFETNDQGATWTNISASLPNIPINCIAVDKTGTGDALYVGTDVGVYYKDASLTVWQPFSTGLPNVVVSQLQMYYGSPAKLRASTYGRGIWETTLYQPGAYPPDANFGSDLKIACPGAAIQFSDWSAGQPTSWSWTFQGGSPSTSTQQNPLVIFNTAGTYSVSLTATNANGFDTQTYNGYITISASPYAAPTTTGDSVCNGGVVNLSATGTGTGVIRWWNQPGGGSVVATGPTYAPNISSTTTYYVDEAFPGGTPDVTGALDNSMGAGANFNANDIRGLYFDVLQPVIINTVSVYSYAAGNRTIEIIDPQGNMFADTTVYIASNPTTLTPVTINQTVYPGTGYFIKFTGMVDCFRNSAGAIYPINGLAINITGSNAGLPGYYYFFYDWNYTVINCNTPRNPVTGLVAVCNSVGDVITGGTLSVFPNPSSGLFTLSFNAKNADNYMVKITNTLGQTVYEEVLTNFSGNYYKKMDIEKNGKGVYTLSISNSNNESIKKIITY